MQREGAGALMGPASREQSLCRYYNIYRGASANILSNSPLFSMPAAFRLVFLAFGGSKRYNNGR